MYVSYSNHENQPVLMYVRGLEISEPCQESFLIIPITVCHLIVCERNQTALMYLKWKHASGRVVIEVAPVRSKNRTKLQYFSGKVTDGHKITPVVCFKPNLHSLFDK